MLLTFLLVLSALTDRTSVSNARTLSAISTAESNNILETLMSIEESEAIYNAQSHQRSKRDVIDIIISGIELIPGVPNLPYRKMLQALNPLKFKVGGDLKGNIKLRKGNVDVTSVVGVRMGILGRMAGVAVGSKGSIGKDGLGFNYGGTIGFGSKKLPDGALANGDTNVPYAKYNSNNITA